MDPRLCGGYPYEFDDYYMSTSRGHLYIHSLKSDRINGVMLSSHLKRVTMLADGQSVGYTQSFAPTSGQGYFRCVLPAGTDALCRTVDFELETDIPGFGTLDNL
jgi:hypothetical protein